MVTALPLHNRALDDLAPLVGDWRVEIRNAEWLDDGASVAGRMSVTWLDGHAFLVLRSRAETGPPASVQVVGRNEANPDYQALYTDDRGVSRVYTMTYTDAVWTQFRADPGFHQRFRAELSPDGRSWDGEWSKSHDGGETWLHDFYIFYTRV